MSIIDFASLSVYMGGTSTLTPQQQQLITDVIIPGVQEELELYLNRPVELVQVRESLAPESDGYIYYSVAPVKQVISVIWSNTGSMPLTMTPYVPDPYVVSSTVSRPVIDYTGHSGTSSPFRHYLGIQGFPGLYSGLADAYVVVDYIAGYDGRNDNALKTALLRVTAREVERQFDSVVGIRSGTLEQAGESDTRLKGWTREELKAFDRLKRRVIV